MFEGVDRVRVQEQLDSGHSNRTKASDRVDDLIRRTCDRDTEPDRLGHLRITRFDNDANRRAHITVDGDSCRGCTTRACVTACPANLFVPTSDGGILFSYEQCFECGTCYLVCNTEGAITWTYPEGGHGVVFRRS